MSGLDSFRDVYADIEASNNPVLMSVSGPWRNKIASWVIAEWQEMPPGSTRRQGRAELTKRVKAKVRQNVGFPWVTIAMLVAQIIIKIIMKRWADRNE
jgi:hypothetical protein